MRVTFALAVLMSSLKVNAQWWNYQKHGDDWGARQERCKRISDDYGQSPIDLPYEIPGLGDIKWSS
jgi:hypothetical protein